MKKLFFIPAVLFIFLGMFLINSNPAVSEEAPPTTSVIGVFIYNEKGEYIEESVSGCIGSLNFGTSTGYILNAGSLPHGNYNVCVSGSGYYGYISGYTVSGSYTYVFITLVPSAVACSICNAS